MKVVMIAPTALACAPYEAMKCINKYSNGRIDVTLVAGLHVYKNGWAFPKDLIWNQNRAACLREITAADIIHVHNRFPSLDLKHACAGKPVIFQFHSCPVKPIFRETIRGGYDCYSISQPLQVRNYGLPTLPNLIDPEEYLPLRNIQNRRPVILYAPTNRLPDDRIGSKGYYTVTEILKQVDTDVRIIENTPYYLNLAEKSCADIIIDDVVGYTWHRTSLEASCFGAAVIGSHHHPIWQYATPKTLLTVLHDLVIHPIKLKTIQLKTREWVASCYHPSTQIELYEKSYAHALTHGKCV
jgi:hypothetical protein